MDIENFHEQHIVVKRLRYTYFPSHGTATGMILTGFSRKNSRISKRALERLSSTSLREINVSTEY
jgi:hypothetical protein